MNRIFLTAKCLKRLDSCSTRRWTLKARWHLSWLVKLKSGTSLENKYIQQCYNDWIYAVTFNTWMSRKRNHTLCNTFALLVRLLRSSLTLQCLRSLNILAAVQDLSAKPALTACSTDSNNTRRL